MPHTIYVPAYTEDGRMITDQRTLRIMNEERTPEDDRRDYESLKAKEDAAKAARAKAERKAREEAEFQAGAQAAAQYGIDSQTLKPANMGVAQMLDAEQTMNAEFEAKKQELTQKYQKPDGGNIARELDELHQKQDAELAAKFARNPLAEQAIGQRNQEFRAQASNWLQSEISAKQQQYFDAVDKKCNDALSAQLYGMQPEQISGALSSRENEMRALGRTPEQVNAARQNLLGSYFQNLATSNPSAFLEATKQPQTDTGNGEAGNLADNSNAPSLQNPLVDLAKDLSEEQLGKFSRLAERAKLNLEKKEKHAAINMRQQEIIQQLTGLDPEDQRQEIEKITASLEDQEMASQIKTRLNLQLDYEERIKAAKDWETGDKIMSQDLEPFQKLEAIAEADISEEAREVLIREVMGEPTPETPGNQQTTLDTILKIDSSGVQSEQQLYAICQQQGLTRTQAAFLKDTLAGKGRINGVPVGMALDALQINNPAFAENSGQLLNATEQLVRGWPEGTIATYKNVAEQAREVGSSIRPENMDALLNSDPSKPQFDKASDKEKPKDNFTLDWENGKIKLDPENPEYDKMKSRYGIAKADSSSEAIDKYGYNQLNKDINAGVWRDLEAKYLEGGNKPVEYGQPAYNRVKTAQNEIKDSAEYWGVSPEAVAACMLDEQTAIAKRGFLPDQLQDWGADGSFLGIPQWVTNSAFNEKAYRTSEEMEKFLKETQTDDDRYYLVAPQKGERLWDLGNYNVNLAVGYKCFERYVLNSQSENPIKQRVMDGLPESANKDDMWKAFISNCLTDQQGQSYVVAAVLKDGQKMVADFIEERRNVNPEEFPEGCYSPEEFNCLVVDTYKKGFPLMKQQYLERVETGNIDPMKAGPGDGLIFNREMINDVLNKPISSNNMEKRFR